MSKPLTDFLLCKNRFVGQDHIIILCTKQPYYKGNVLFFTDLASYMDFAGASKDLAFAKVSDHLIVIKFTGTLDNKVMIHQSIKAELDSHMKMMAEFFYKHEIEHKPLVYKKYKY